MRDSASFAWIQAYQAKSMHPDTFPAPFPIPLVMAAVNEVFAE
jgi:hypothetical protein